MSLQVLAQDMASRGRGGDTMLVHMAPSEVAGLQALAMANGGTLTTNPDTGLPEANALKSLLPMLIGAGLTFMTGGTGAALIPGLSNAATIGLGVGGLEAARTGSLRKGLMAGLGAYGGAGLGTGLADMGAQQIAGKQIAEEAAKNAVAEGLTLPANYAQAAAQSATPAQIAAVQSTTPALDVFKSGIQSLGAEGGGANFMRTVGGIPKLAQYGGAALLPLLSETSTPAPPPRDTEQYRFAYSPGRSMPPTRLGNAGEYTYYQPSFTRLAAGGGLMDLPVEQMSARDASEEFAANGAQMYAGGGISHLGDYSDGGRLLRGPGDGVSDDIPATIGQKQPARLADGEFVVPARIVSELGNGSTEAGARKLYSMMDRVQNARRKTVGKDKVAVNSRAEKLLPA